MLAVGNDPLPPSDPLARTGAPLDINYDSDDDDDDEDNNMQIDSDIVDPESNNDFLLINNNNADAGPSSYGHRDSVSL
jgi:hypothetical protein